jgi:hypothetical protein
LVVLIPRRFIQWSSTSRSRASEPRH